MNASAKPVDPQKNCSEIISQTLATLVLYNTSLGDSITFQTLGKCLEKMGCSLDILIYDNSANAQKIESSGGWNITYVHNTNNPGVSKAYNSGFELAKEKGKKWLLLLDQDTEYTSSLFNDYCISITQYPDQTVFVPKLYDGKGMVSPLLFNWGGGQRIDGLTPGVYSIRQFKFHNCGIFISVDSFEQAGSYDEQLPLDFSDFSFVDRLQKKQSSFVVTATTGIHHLASTSTATIEERAERFRSYIKSCQYYQREYRPHDYLISIRLFLRSVKLSLEYRTFQFITLYLNG